MSMEDTATLVGLAAERDPLSRYRCSRGWAAFCNRHRRIPAVTVAASLAGMDARRAVVSERRDRHHSPLLTVSTGSTSRRLHHRSICASLMVQGKIPAFL